MSEEEVIKEIKDMIIAFDVQGYIREKSFIKEELKASNVLQEMLDLYNKQKQEAEHYKAENSIRNKCLFNIAEKVGITKNGITESMIINAIDNNYISKDKVLKALGYEENDEEYKRIYNKEELILSLIRTINEECDRLEDIEDQKTMLEIHNIENQRDKYWQDKIKNTLLKFQNEYGEDLETTGRLFIGKEVVQYGEDMIDEIAKELDIKLLEE